MRLPESLPQENRQKYISISEAVSMLGISNRAAWIRKLNKFQIKLLEQDNTVYMNASDFEQICLEKEQYALLDTILSGIEQIGTPAERMQVVTFLRHLQLICQSEELRFTVLIRQFFIQISQKKAIRAAVQDFFCIMNAPEQPAYYTCQQAAQRLRKDPLWFAAQMVSNRLNTASQSYADGFRYISQAYVLRCEAYKAERGDLKTLLPESITIEQAVSALQGQFTIGQYESWYCGCEYDWYYLRKDRTMIIKALRSLQSRQDTFAPRMIAQSAYVNALYYIQEPLCGSRLDPDKQQCKLDYHRFLTQNADKLGLISDEQDWLPVELTDFSRRLLDIYMLTYDKIACEQYPVLLQRLQDKMPETVKLISQIDDVSAACVSVMIHFLIYDCVDLPKMTNTQMKKLISVFDHQPKADALYFQQLVSLAHEQYNCVSTVMPDYLTIRRKRRTVTAYDAEQYAAMAYFIFNPSYAKKAQLLDKACHDSRMAEAWLYLALHWICALRRSDLQRLPMVSLPSESPDVLIENICAQQYPDTVYDTFLTRFEIQLQAVPQKPNKTMRYMVPDIKLFFPQSLRPFFGMLFLLVLAHRQREGRDAQPMFRIPRYTLLSRFFGDEFLRYTGGDFSSLRSNKSYLQSIEQTADELSDEELKIQGYYLASIARSHKSGYAEFSKTTAIYLRDAKFGDINPEYVAMQMFERGVLSFIPHLMLSFLMGKDYNRLSIAAQTICIQQVNMTPNEIEQIFSVSQNALQHAKQHVEQLLQDVPKRTIQYGLQAIGAGTAPSKGPNSYCLLYAIGQSCPHLGPTCTGCPYEIQTQADLYLLTKQFEEVTARYVQSGHQPMQAKKYHHILVQNLLPQISQMLTYIHQTRQDTLPVGIWAKEVVAKCLPKLNPQIDI